MRTTVRLILVAMFSALMLSACSDDDGGAQPPAVEEQPPTENENDTATPDEESKTAEEETDQAMDRMREGAESFTEGAKQLFEEGREAADRALEDAGPALERAGEAAEEIGKAVDEIVERAMADFDAAIDALNERIDEAGIDRDAIEGGPQTALAPSDQLREDTLAAARAGPAGIGADYVGVWAGEAEDCQRIDQEPVEMFAVITPTTIRRFESVCNFDRAQLSGDSVTVDASCIAEGTTEDREITFSMPSDDALTIGSPAFEAEAELMRCHLAQ